MIYTVTLNPSVDYIVGVDNLELGSLNITSFETKSSGGKGINVSRVLKRLGQENTALGFLGGFTGAFISEELSREGVSSDFVHVGGDTRINIKLKTGEETEINGQGPEITENNLAGLERKLETLGKEDVVIFAGSIPKSVPDTVYQFLAQKAKSKGAEVIIDAKGGALKNALAEQPFLVKPNHHELGGLFDAQVETMEDALIYGRKLLDLGPQNVIVSMGGKGALFLNSSEAYAAAAPEGKVKNTVGAGDSVVAGFTASYLETADKKEAFRYGIATGSATAFSLGFAEKTNVEALLEKVKMIEI
ncbi:1-phosphofructokinase [Bacillus marinisedimentorum]|uniref:1-phosphofructokinase n=1 Tax=Bacillus marinisedimentorum TaxID=1821260 RepID=UPI000872B863|nr:1-phosphofructokinase [Bacillus marinisedimentorum]